MVPDGKSIAETHMITDRNTDSITGTDMDRDMDDSDGNNTCVTNIQSIMYESQLQHLLKYVITNVHKVSINMIMYVYDDEYYNLFYAIIVSNAKT